MQRVACHSADAGCARDCRPPPPPPAFISTIKIRQAGFNEVIDTEDMFRYWLANFIERRIVPGPAS